MEEKEINDLIQRINGVKEEIKNYKEPLLPVGEKPSAEDQFKVLQSKLELMELLLIDNINTYMNNKNNVILNCHFLLSIMYAMMQQIKIPMENKGKILVKVEETLKTIENNNQNLSDYHKTNAVNSWNEWRELLKGDINNNIFENK